MTITPSAQDYLNDLMSNQDEDTCGIKIFVSEPGTPRAETCIAYAKQDEDFSDYRIKRKLKISSLNFVDYTKRTLSRTF